MLSVDFKSPISFDILIDKIEEVSTTDGIRVWIEGTGYFGTHEEQTGFYCPEELEHLLRDISVKKGDKILIMYLGFSRKGGRKKEFYVRPSEREEEDVLEIEIEDDIDLKSQYPDKVEINETGTIADPEVVIDTGGTEVPDEYEKEIDFDEIMKEIEDEE